MDDILRCEYCIKKMSESYDAVLYKMSVARMDDAARMRGDARWQI
jgi:trans-2-enoyl-CoA reductase